jgi:tetratricopeptide (TPR) repeat protein
LLAFRSAFTTGSWVSVVVGVAGYGLALGSKETGVALPVVLLAYDRFGLPQAADEAQRRRRWIVHAALMSFTALAAGVRAWLYVTVEQPSRAGFGWDRAVAALDALAEYVSLLLIPVRQTFVHGVPPIAHIYGWPLIRAIAILGTILVLAFRLRRSHPAASFGLLWTLVWLIPGVALVLLAEAGQPMAERRAYLASCGLFLIVALLLEHWCSAAAPLRVNKLRYVAAVATIAVALSALTLARNRLWSDPILLWEDAVRKAPTTWVAQFGLADAYQAIGDCESAIPVYERAITVGRENVQAYDGLAACLVELQRSDEARDVLRTALKRVPDAVHVRVSLAGLERRANHVDEAVRLCREVRAMAPDTADARACLTP